MRVTRFWLPNVLTLTGKRRLTIVRRSNTLLAGKGTAVGAEDYARTSEEAFIWKSDRAQVKLSQLTDGWLVEYSTVGRLLGPPQVLHVGRHRDPRLAAWDVMSRVQAAAKDDVIGMQAGLSAAKWIKTRPHWNEFLENGPGQPSAR